MSETAANRATTLCGVLAALGALAGLLINSGGPTAAPAGPVPVVHAAQFGGR